MLVFTRRVGEDIVIGGDIRVTVLGVAGGKARLGVTAPRPVRVDRAEIAERAVAPAARPRPEDCGEARDCRVKDS
jgi:carbon storage regulator